MSRAGNQWGSKRFVMSTTQDSPAVKNFAPMPQGKKKKKKKDCNVAGQLPFKCFLKFEILALFIYPSIENLLCEKHAENVLMEPHV